MLHYTHYSSTVTKLGSFSTMHCCILHLMNVSRLRHDRIYNQWFTFSNILQLGKVYKSNLVETSVWVPCTHSVLIFYKMSVCSTGEKNTHGFPLNLRQTYQLIDQYKCRCTRSIFEIFKSPIPIMAKKLPKTAQTIDKHLWSEIAHKVPCKMVLTAFL